MDTSKLPRPSFSKRIWLKGIQYRGETAEQMAAREKAWEEEDRKRSQEIERLWKWKTTPLWET